MTIFNFYALENKASEERKDLFGEVSDAVNADKQPVSATPEDCLGSFFETNHSLELPVLITSGNGSGAAACWDKHKCDVLRHEGGVILMTVEANKSKHMLAPVEQLRGMPRKTLHFLCKVDTLYKFRTQDR